MTKGKQGKTEQEEEKDFKERAIGGTKEEQPLKTQEIAFLAFPPKKNENKDKKQNHPKNKTNKNTFLYVDKQPQFG